MGRTQLASTIILRHYGTIPSSERGRGLIELFGGEKTSQNKNFDNHTEPLTSINSVIDHRDDGNVLIARVLSDALLTKICWGILTP